MIKTPFRFAAAVLLCLQTFGFAADQKSSVPELIHALKSQEPDQREHAAEALGEMGPEAASAVKALGVALNDDFPYVRSHSGEALTKIGPASIPVLVDALKNPNEDVRSIAASALGDFGPQANAAVPGLITLLHDSASPVRERAANALEQIGPDAVEPLLHLLETHHDGSTLLALRTLGGIKTTNETLVPQLLKILESTNDQIRMAANKALARQGKSHLQELLPGLKSENSQVRAQVADILADVGRQGSAAIPALIELLNDSAPSVRGSAARALGHMDSVAAKPAVAPLKTLLNDSDPTVVSRAREALTNLTAATQPSSNNPEQQPMPFASKEDTHKKTSPSPTKAKMTVVKKTKAKPASKLAAKKSKRSLSAEDLVKLLPNEDETVREGAVKALTQMGPKAIPALTQALQDGTTTVRQATAEAFIQIDSSAALHALDETAKAGDLGIRLDALLAMQTLNEGAQESVPTLISLLKDPSTDIQAAAETTLAHIGTDDAKKALDQYHQQQEQKKIAGYLKDLRQEGKTSSDAAAALVKLGAPAVKPISQLLSDPRPTGRRAAAHILNQLGPTSAPAAAALITALDDSDSEVRHQSAEALGKINTPDAKSALRYFPIKDLYYKLKSYVSH